MAAIEANGQTIEYTEVGSGRPLLLIMGLAGQLIDWPDEMIDRLADSGFRVIRHDNRDSGLSSATPTAPPTPRELLRLSARRQGGAAYTINDLADDAAGLLQVLDTGPAHVAGVSMGGMVAQAVATRYRDQVSSLTSIMSNTGDRWRGQMSLRVLLKLLPLRNPDPDRAVEAFTDAFGLFAGSTWDRAEHLVRARASIERSYRPEGTLHQVAAIASSPDRTRSLRTLDVPTLVIHGLQDTLVKPSGGLATVRAVPGARLLMFPDMGHDLPPGRLGEMVEAIAANAVRAPALA